MLSAFEEVENALVAYSNEQVRYDLLQQAVRSGNEAMRSATQRYASGTGSFLDVLAATRSLYDAQDKLAQSDAGRSLYLVSLYKSLGGGWESERFLVSSRDDIF